MANTNLSSINLSPLDFDLIKSNFINYLKTQTIFSDYNFNDSNLNVLLDILSYNTFQNSFYLNMVASEAFLDSAQLKNSVISHAKELNYVPRSARSAKAVVNLNFSSNTNIVTLPKGTSFTSLVGSNILTFITDRDNVFFASNGSFDINNLEIYEGKLVTEQFIVNYENTIQRFIISNKNIDTRSLSVSVIEDNSGTILTYTKALTTLDLNGESQVFFLQAAEDDRYELIFGDNIIGRRPKDGAIITVTYRISSTTHGNGASKFTLDTEFVTFTTSPTVATVNVADGGAEAEDINSIKFYAPRYFQIQERAINVNDYEIILKQKFPEINAIAAYGGEEVSPPQYGHVFISVDISDVDGLPQSKIDEYYNYIKPRSPLSIEPQFVIPNYLFYSVDSTVKYDISSTNLAEEQVQSMVVNAIINYNNENFNDFKSSFRYSKFVANIDNITNAEIISNDTTIKLYKKISISTGVSQNADILFDIALTKMGSKLETEYEIDDLVTIESSGFIYNGETVFVNDDNSETLRLVKIINNKKVVVLPNIGSIDYNSGTLKLVNFRIDAYDIGQNSLKIFAVPLSKDFETSKNVILALEPNQIDVKVEPVAVKF